LRAFGALAFGALLSGLDRTTSPPPRFALRRARLCS
jgi:hypothetical protein